MFPSSVGDSAKNALHTNPQNTVFDAKRLIGRNYNDSEVQKDTKHWYVGLAHMRIWRLVVHGNIGRSRSLTRKASRRSRSSIEGMFGPL